MAESLAIGFLLGWIGSMPIAGAVSIFVFQRGLAGRVRDGMRLAAGAGIAEALWCAAARLGAGHVVARWPAVGTAAESVGGVVLVVLGIVFLRRRRPLTAAPSVRGASAGSGNFRLGFALVVGNVSIPVNWLALITIAHSVGPRPLAGPPGAFALGVALGILGWFTVLVLLLDHLRTRLAERTLPLIMQAMGALLIVAGLVAMARVWLF
ncbi:MAG: LysE family transporter [Candidatus Krumholzibacteriia bacterium]